MIITGGGGGGGGGGGAQHTFDLKVRSERFAAAAAILRMSGLLLDFMMSVRQRDVTASLNHMVDLTAEKKMCSI